MAGFGDKPYGIRDIKLTNLAGTTQVDLPQATTLGFTEQLNSGTMRGDDSVAAIAAFTDSVEWQFEAGGLPLEALALMTGRTVVASGTTPNQLVQLNANAGDSYPYFKVYGLSKGDTGIDDVHVKIYKCKLTGAIEGTFKDKAFFMTSCKGVAIDPGGGNLYEIVQHETSIALATS